MSILYKCRSCNKLLDQDATIYRCCDSTVCSQACSAKIINSIIRIDPTLTSSHKWENILECNCKPIVNNTSTILLSISHDSDSDDDDNYLSEYDDYYLFKMSSDTLCEINHFYNKAKTFIFQKIIKYAP